MNKYYSTSTTAGGGLEELIRFIVSRALIIFFARGVSLGVANERKRMLSRLSIILKTTYFNSMMN
jgi:hypothetical protein